MKISTELTDGAILQEIGARLAQRRIEAGRTQAKLAEQAGIAKRTLERIEAGHGAELVTLIRVLRALELTDGLDSLVRDLPPSPIAIARATRQAAPTSRAAAANRRPQPASLGLGASNRVTTLAEVRLWGRTIGAVSLEDGERRRGVRVRPARLPAAASRSSPLTTAALVAHLRVSRPAARSFHGLPGLLADSLPDRFGNALIDAWLATQGRTPESFNAVERLCYMGARGMGALEFAPALGLAARAARRSSRRRAGRAGVPGAHEPRRAQRVVRRRAQDRSALQQILQVGTSAGGARAKAVIAWNPDTNEVRSGQVRRRTGFGYWLLKFDGVAGNKDKELDDPQGYTVIEYAYSLMAKDAGLTMTECRLLEEGGRRHFMTRRFDRTEDGDKLHMQSLAALAHFDFNAAGRPLLRAGVRCDPAARAAAGRRRAAVPADGLQHGRAQPGRPREEHRVPDGQGGRVVARAGVRRDLQLQPGGRVDRAHQMTLNGKRDGVHARGFPRGRESRRG